MEGQGGEAAKKDFPKKPKLTKAERRELQERQRAAKEAARASSGNSGGGKKGKGADAAKGGGGGGGKKAGGATDAAPSRGPNARGAAGRQTPGRHVDPKQVELFAHLSPFSAPNSHTVGYDVSLNDMHPAVVGLGLQFADPTCLTDANDRSLALLRVIQVLVKDYVTPPGKAFQWELLKRVRQAFQFLTDCRPHSISMGNAMQFVRNAISSMDPEVGDEEAKDGLCEDIDEFIKERITLAGELIATTASRKIRDGDVILTFSRCPVIERLLRAAKNEGKRFHVVLVDSRPGQEGRECLKALAKDSIPCTYVLLNAVSFAMKHVTKVFLEASAIMSNGAALARIGTAVVAMAANARNIPVIFCCETYKLADKVQLDSIVSNELSDPEALVSGLSGGDELTGWKDIPGLKLLNLRHDLTPIKFVDSVVTEVGMIPPTAVPVLLREYRRETGAAVKSEVP